MLHVEGNFVPILTSEAGLCLTTSNWKEVNVFAGSYYLEHLLYKPGGELLRKITDLARYLVSPGTTIINAQSLRADKKDIYLLKSPYDGSRIRLTSVDVYELIHHLKPNIVILPQKMVHNFPQIWDNWDQSIIPFIDVNDLEEQNIKQAHGVYFNHFNLLNEEQLNQWLHVPRYAVGNFDLELIKKLREQGIGFIETDEPAKAALRGRVYSRSGEVDLTNLETRMQFQTIDKHCICPTCKQQFTQAYLHHLLQHTPLLCQRLLIQHNVFYVQNI